jgi:hypothetical protein
LIECVDARAQFVSEPVDFLIKRIDASGQFGSKSVDLLIQPADLSCQFSETARLFFHFTLKVRESLFE